MKVLALALITVVALSSAKNINLEAVVELEDLTSYGYLTKIGEPLANKLRAAEERPSRITGGSPSALGQFPYQAGLVIHIGNREAVCGGSLLSGSKVLTAAHCWFDGLNQASAFTVVLGSITVFYGGTRITTSDVVMHENWIPSLIRNDIAMINLPSAVSSSSTISPIALPSGEELNNLFTGSVAVASGFGLIGDGVGLTPDQFLSHVELGIISNSVCAGSYGTFIQDSNICTSADIGKNVCSSDSGGPLAVVSNDRIVLVGVTSFGSGNGCESGAPSAFARVTYYINWINSNL